MSENQNCFSRREFLSKLGLSTGAVYLAQGLAFSNPAKASISRLGKEKDLYPVYKDGKYLKKDFSHLMTNKELGLSKENIENHLGLYYGYVDNVNKAEAMMARNEVDEFSLKHLAFSLNGMALHDIYFSNMSTSISKASGGLKRASEEAFGSFDNYKKNLYDIALKMEGWSLTCVNMLNGKIFNYGEDTHSSNFPNFVIPILALDVYEHAYIKDFGKEGKTKYLNVFSDIIDWDLVSRRYDAVKALTSPSLFGF